MTEILANWTTSQAQHVRREPVPDRRNRQHCQRKPLPWSAFGKNHRHERTPIMADQMRRRCAEHPMPMLRIDEP